MIKMSIFILPLLIYSKTHYGKVEPFETMKLISPEAASVTVATVAYEGSFVYSKKIIQLAI